MKKIGIIALVCLNVGCTSFNPKVRESDTLPWQGVEVSLLDDHPLFQSIPMDEEQQGALTIRNYRNQTCNNRFFIRNGLVLRYQPEGSCYTDERVRPGYSGQVGYIGPKMNYKNVVIQSVGNGLGHAGRALSSQNAGKASCTSTRVGNRVETNCKSD